jgi:hypothetical protein
MYIRHDTSIERPIHEVRWELSQEPERWLPAAVTSPLGPRTYRVRVGFRALVGRISKEVELTVGEPAAAGDWLSVPVAWRATGASGLFPVLDGRLTVQPLAPRSSIVWVGANYHPPLGGLGHELDEVALHNVATATIEDFVAGVAARLSQLERPAPSALS